MIHPIIREIREQEAQWAAKALSLPKDAFLSGDPLDSRFEILRSRESIDVEACPGSGKTTLLVAKIAILARDWQFSNRGMCVLSHTNAAREEIESKLTTLGLARNLLSYPHFIGTIHGFINEFVALPWLRSIGMPVQAIDDDIALGMRWRHLPNNIRFGLEKRKNPKEFARVRNPGFELGEVAGFGTGTATYKAILKACEESANRGYYCHSEMLLWGVHALRNTPVISIAIRERFPLVFIDEVQDNDDVQSKLLKSLFEENGSQVILQRFGDLNQAIFEGEREPDTDSSSFPVSSRRQVIGNSHRFIQEIADCAKPLAFNSLNLRGREKQGDDEPNIANPTVVLLFAPDDIDYVLPCFALLLLKSFSSETLLKGRFCAIGAVHRSPKESYKPHSVPHYFAGYQALRGFKSPRMTNGAQFLTLAIERSKKFLHTSHVVDALARIILHCALLTNKEVDFQNLRGSSNQRVQGLLADNAEVTNLYRSLLTSLVLLNEPIGPEDWDKSYKTQVTEVVSGISGKIVASAVDDFLQWREEAPGTLVVNDDIPYESNLFVFPYDRPKVQVELGSIHSAKGATHTATLVLETYYRSHNLKKLVPWLLGRRSGADNPKGTEKYRLKQHYVALSRPRSLLCLAMLEDSFSKAELKLLKENWSVARVTAEGPTWI